jgi:TPR repeat
VQGQYVAAISCYSEALALDPQNFKALFNRGFSYDKAGDQEAAIKDYTAAIEVDPQNSFAFYNRGIAKDRKGDFQGAVADFTIAISLEAGNADFYHNRGFSLRKQVPFPLCMVLIIGKASGEASLSRLVLHSPCALSVHGLRGSHLCRRGMMLRLRTIQQRSSSILGIAGYVPVQGKCAPCTIRSLIDCSLCTST